MNVGTPDVAAPRTAGNPYVGPRSFGRHEALYGRERESADLVDLLVAERVVLLHSPSGAGKTSLINARLIPLLEDDRFEVLPTIRLNHELPPNTALNGSPPNRYVLSTMLSIEEGLPPEHQRRTEEIVGLTLEQYLNEWPDLDGIPGNEVLIFDQFEEIIISDPTDHAAKNEFFTQLGVALRDRSVWALFAIREDFLAELDPYARLIPTRFTNRYRLDLLTEDAALQAMMLPARDAGIAFEPEAAGRLADDLRRVRLQRPGGIVEELGRYVEPVQLQVVCRQIWSRLPPHVRSIGQLDIEAVGDVNQALAGYYAECMASAAVASGVPERALRDWVERELITPQGFRGPTLSGPRHEPAADELVLRSLTDAHLLRAENRRGAVWHELAHDRLIDPVQADNVEWRSTHLTDVERRAMLWDEQGRPDNLLMTSKELDTAEAAGSPPTDQMPERDREFLLASRREHTQRQRAERARRRIKRWLLISIAVSVVALLLFGTTLYYLVQLREERDRAHRVALVGQGRGVIDFDADLSLQLGLRAAHRQADAGERMDPDTQSMLQSAIDATPVIQVLQSDTPATAAAYSNDGTLVATGHPDGTVRVWDLAADREIATLPGPERILGLDFGTDPTGKPFLAAVGVAGRAILWSPGSDRAPSTFGKRNAIGNLFGVAISPDGSQVASVGADGEVVISTVASGEVRLNLQSQRPGTPAAVWAVAWTPDGNHVLAADAAGYVSSWEAASGRLAWTTLRHLAEISSIAVSRDGSRLVSVGWDGMAVVQDVATGVQLARFETAGRSPVAVSFPPEPDQVLVLDSDGTATVSKLDGTTLSTVEGHGMAVAGADTDPRGTGRAVVITDTGSAAVWDVSVANGEVGSEVVVTADGKVITTSFDGVIRAYSTAGVAAPIVGTDPKGITYAAASADGRRMVTIDDDGAAKLWQLNGSAAPPRTLLNRGATAVALNADGSLAVMGVGVDVELWDTVRGIRLQAFRGHVLRVNAVAFAPDGRRLVSVAQDNTAKMWRIGDTEPERVIRTGGTPFNVAWSSTGWIATAGASGVVQLWDADADTTPVLLKHHVKAVNDVAFDRTGEWLVSVGEDREIAVWNTRTGKLQSSFAHRAAGWQVDFAADGRSLLVFSDRGAPYQIWRDDRDTLRVAEERTTRDLLPQECERYAALNACTA